VWPPVAVGPSSGQDGRMSDLPFSVSPEAAAYVEETLRQHDGDPELAGLLPALCRWLDSQTLDSDGNLVERFDRESWGLGYHDPTKVAGKGYVTIQIGGRSLLIYPDHLVALAGKRLVMETVGVGVPRPADKKARLLRAV
jgi:hypothetical protein